MLYDVGFIMDLEMDRIGEWKRADRLWSMYVSADTQILDYDPEGAYT